MSTTISAAVGAIITAIVTGIGYALKHRSDKTSADNANWAAFNEANREWTERKLAERDKALDELRADFKDLSAKVDNLSSKYNVSLGYIIVLWTGGQHDPPEVIAGDLPTPPWVDPT